ncbi:MAG: sulfotransferase [Proteobacteria bacterium]|nr:sulfotransferase [Pseudomonadota bacterium]
MDQPTAAPLRRYGAARERGDLTGALRAASDACHAAPTDPAAHYAYGEAWTALGNHANAARAFAEAIRLNPGWADAWINLGLARYREGDIADAKLAMRQALTRAPGHAAALANLAAFMRISGESEAAEHILRTAIDQQPAQAAARLNLAAEMLQEERGAEAVALLDAAPALPDDPAARRHWLLTRALALLQAGRAADVPPVLRDFVALGPIPPELAPLLLWRYVLLAQATGDTAAAARAADAMARALDRMGPNAVPEHRIMGHYDLAKFWSGHGQSAAAFHHWRQGHALLRPTQPFSRDAHRAFIDACITRLDRARLHDGPRAANTDSAPVFIVGMPRSGTTLCEQILGAHPSAHGAGERAALGQAFATLGGGTDAEAVARLAALQAVALDRAADAYLADLHALAPQADRVIDKLPGNYRYLGLVGLMLPGARIIHCVRDPRDIGLSIFTFRFHGDHGYAHDLRDLGWTIAQQERLMTHWKAALPNPVLTVALSDWVTEFDTTLARVLAHVGLPHATACERFYEQESRVRTVSRAQVRQPVNARGLGRWRTYAEQLGPLIEELHEAGMLPDEPPPDGDRAG